MAILKNADSTKGLGDLTASSTKKKYWSLEDVLELEAKHENFVKNGIENIEEALLTDVQADILKSANHKYSLYCFLKFNKHHRKAVADWLKHLPLTSAMDQIKNKDSPMISLSLSFHGYEFFCDPQKIENQIPLEDDDIQAFREGLSERCYKAFGGIKKRFLERNYRKPAHALILIASNDKKLSDLNSDSQARKGKRKLLDFFIEYTTGKADEGSNRFSFEEKFGDVFFEIGLKNPEGTSGDAQDWFGFKDGISNPRFFPREDLDLGFKPDPPSKLNTVLRKNELSPKPYACGSFLVYLKLEENVGFFKKQMKLLADILGFNNTDQVAAYILGRKKTGTPLHSSYLEEETGKKNLNDFDFTNDPDGEVCPMHAHIRKVNPRDGTANNRIVRRGRVYGDKYSKSGKKGILFLSYQSSLRTFEDIINRGIYGYNYRRRNIGQDFLFAEDAKYQKAHRYKNAQGISMKPYLRGKQVVKFRGGQYFFTSSISFVKVNLENCM